MKKIVYVTILVIVSLVIYSNAARATQTVTVTTEVLNIRKKASTSSDVVATLSEGVKCELLEEDGEWYKVKYKTYTGYVAKEYVKKNSDATTEEVSKPKVEDTNTTGQDTTVPATDDTNNKVTGKIAKKSDVKLLPLIYSSKIDSLNKDVMVTILTQMNGWSYIQTDMIAGWIRSDNITGKKTISSNTNNNTNDNKADANKTDNNDKKTDDNKTDTNQTYKEKTMYINDSFVNLRKEANTSSDVLMVVALNTKLTVIGESGDWYKVKTSEGNAYVLKELLSSQQVTSSRGGMVKKKNENIETTTENTQTTNSQKTTTSEDKTTTTTSSKKSTTNTSSNSSKKGQEVVSYAKKFLKVPYVYGGASKSGFDCSGFTMYVYKKFGVSMSHSALAQSKIGKAVKVDTKSSSSIKKNLQPGDLVFFLEYKTMDEVGHCGIYIGNGNFIHASSGSGYCVKINNLLPGDYYNKRFCAARRVI